MRWNVSTLSIWILCTGLVAVAGVHEDSAPENSKIEANVPVLPGVVEGFDHNIRKNRFISINPNNPTIAARLKIELLDLACSVTGNKCNSDADCRVCVGGTNNGESCVHSFVCAGGGNCEQSGESCEVQGPPLFLGYVGEPQPNDCLAPRNMLISVVTDEVPAFRCWAESLVHIVDCEIAPAQTYGITAESEGSHGRFSAPLIIGTAPKPQLREWADIVGNFDGVTWDGPNGIVNVTDINAMIRLFSRRPKAPHASAAILVGAWPDFVTQCGSISVDLGAVIVAFRGGQFPPRPLLVGGYPDLHAGATLADCSGN